MMKTHDMMEHGYDNKMKTKMMQTWYKHKKNTARLVQKRIQVGKAKRPQS